MIKNVFHCLSNYIRLKSKIKFNKELNKAILSIEKRKWTIFRAISVENTNDKHSIVLCLTFKFYYNFLKLDQFISFFQIPFFVGMPGFQGKLWTFDKENKCFQGIYQWESTDYAKMYLKSYAIKFVKRKAKKSTVEYKIIMDTNLNEFINNHIYI